MYADQLLTQTFLLTMVYEAAQLKEEFQGKMSQENLNFLDKDIIEFFRNIVSDWEKENKNERKIIQKLHNYLDVSLHHIK